MSLTIALPGLIWPDAGDIDYLYKDLQTPFLNKFIKKAKLKYHDYNYSDLIHNVIPTQVGIHETESNTTLAYQTARILQIDREFKYFLFAEPTHLRVDRDRLLISEAELLQLDQTECSEIITAINTHFTPEFKLYYISEHLWLLGLNIDPLAEKFYPIIDIIGENINDYLPCNKNSLQYNKFLNEVQMLLFSLNVNKTRQIEGSLTISSLWLWDKSPTKLDMHYQQIYANNNLSRLKHDKISPEQMIEDRGPKTENHVQHLNRGKVTNLNLSSVFSLPSSYCHPRLDLGSIGGKSNTLLIIDTLHYPSCYRDFYAWRDKIEDLDNKIFATLAKLNIKNYRLLIPMQNKTLELSQKSILGMFSKNNLITLAKEWHEK